MPSNAPYHPTFNLSYHQRCIGWRIDATVVRVGRARPLITLAAVLAAWSRQAALACKSSFIVALQRLPLTAKHGAHQRGC